MARFRNKLQGVNKVLRNLNDEIKHIKGVSMKGLIKSAILIRRDMDKTPPVIPVDLGNLRASSFVVASTMTDTDGKFVGPNSAELSAEHTSMIAKEKQIVSGKNLVAIGFSANYGLEVESDTTKKRKRPGSGAHFFESSIARNKKAIILVIKKEAKIK